MIEKIVEIKNVGRFRIPYSHPQPSATVFASFFL